MGYVHLLIPSFSAGLHTLPKQPQVRRIRRYSPHLVNLLGKALPDHKLIKIAMRQFYGVGPVVADKIMARLQFHDQLRVRDLSERQLNSLSALLSAPSAHPRPSTPLRPYSLSSTSSSSSSASSSSAASSADLIPRDPPPAEQDALVNLQIEEDLLRKVRGDIAHLYSIGTWRGLRHAMRLPVRGQKSHPNAKSARKLNRLERRAYSTRTRAGAVAGAEGAQTGIPQASRPSVLGALRTLHASTGRPSLSSMFR
ncbi:hypothetical protein JCM10908_003205 [Rhodotorula pacifica]|uniref:mitochondrial 37S ribosomal protein uS13m SWS2 n=1 Tax=Rhodotorula pacifica TaxID=1495444 RepID=UPI003180B71C